MNTARSFLNSLWGTNHFSQYYDRVRELHEFIEERSATGKVTSIATLEMQARAFNEGDALMSVELAYVLGGG